jgi:Zn-dependent protease with chaperone function
MIIQSKMRLVAASVGPFIVTGIWFKRLPKIEQDAVLAHEQAHLDLRHQWVRWWWIISLQFSDIHGRCCQQEYDADEHAAKRGHGEGLIRFLRRFSESESKFHPSAQMRIQKLLALQKIYGDTLTSV